MIASRLVEKALKGADAAQALVRQTDSVDVSFENDRLKSTQTSQRTTIEVKVVADGQMGSSVGTDINDLDGVVTRARETAQFGSPAHHQFPGPAAAAEVSVHSDDVVQITKPEMVQIGREMMSLIKAYDPDILVGAEIRRAIAKTEFANSAGAQFTEESTVFGVDAGGVLVRGTDVLHAGHSMAWRTLDIDHTAIARQTIHWFRLAEDFATIQSGDLPVILTPNAASILLLTLWLGLDGKNVLLGSSPLAAKLGQTVADPRFTLVDDAHVAFAPASRRYDAEGVPNGRTPLIQAGVVENFLYDLDTAARAGVQSTGHSPERGPTNLLIAPGDTSYDDMVKSIDEGLLVHDVLGLGQGNPISGQFSVNVQLGYRIRKGEIVGRVKDVMLAGNVYDALNAIEAIGDEAQWLAGLISGSYPYIHIGKLSVVAR